jgi:glycosyltransferase involved in cell wall biosynthesis
MRILLANYRYFVSGGPERYMFNVTDALTARGHEVIPFSIKYARNRPTPYDRYFVEPLGGPDEVLFHEHAWTRRTLLRTMSRLCYAPDVARAVSQLAADTQPQVAYVLHYLRKLSPSLLVGLKKAGLPIVVRLSDYAMLCPASICWRDGQPCEFCVLGNLWPSIRYRCVQRSLTASLLNALAMWYHRSQHLFDLVDVFVTTTAFMYRMMVAAGFPENRLRHIPTFVNTDVFYPAAKHDQSANYVLFAGRIDVDKGVHILLSAWREFEQVAPGSGLVLRIAGHAQDTKYMESLRSMATNRVEFLGSLDTAELAQQYRGAYLTVVPSLWYDNLPNSILESYASGTPVIASDLGSLKECVIEGESGYRFEPGDSAHLAHRLRFCLDHPELVLEMSKKSRQLAMTTYASDRHMTTLETLFSELVERRGQR